MLLIMLCNLTKYTMDFAAPEEARANLWATQCTTIIHLFNCCIRTPTPDTSPSIQEAPSVPRPAILFEEISISLQKLTIFIKIVSAVPSLTLILQAYLDLSEKTPLYEDNRMPEFETVLEVN